MLHPDKHLVASEEERALAGDASAAASAAFAALSSPLLRGLHMLELAGLAIDEDTAVEDMELLMEIMEINEAVEEAEGDPEAMAAAQAHLESRIAGIEAGGLVV